MIAVLWLALGAATLAALWVAHRAEARVAGLLAAAPRVAARRRPGPLEDAVSTPGEQAEWDEHVNRALNVARTEKADLAAWDAETREAEGIAIAAAAGDRAWDLHQAGNGGTGEAA